MNDRVDRRIGRDDPGVHPLPEMRERAADDVDAHRPCLSVLEGLADDDERGDDEVRDVRESGDPQARERLADRASGVGADAVLSAVFPENVVDQVEIEQRREAAGEQPQPDPLTLRRGCRHHEHDAEKGRSELIDEHFSDIFSVFAPEFLHKRSLKK